MLYFPHHLPFTVFFWSLCGSNSNINGFSFTTHSDVTVFHLFSVACRPPLRSVIDAGLQTNHKNSENDIKSSWQPTRLQNFGVIIVASLMSISNCFPSPVNFSSLYVSFLFPLPPLQFKLLLPHVQMITVALSLVYLLSLI